MLYKIYSVENELTSPQIARALAESCPYNYQIVTDASIPNPDDVWVGFGSPYHWNSLQAHIKNGGKFIFADHAYFFRHKYYRITSNAFFHHGHTFSDGVRFSSLRIFIKDWQRGKHIVIAPQSDPYCRRVIGLSQDDWIEKIRYKISKFTDRKVVVHQKRDAQPLTDALKNAHALVTYSSNSAVVSILNGVPAFCLADCPAKNMSQTGLSLIEQPYYPSNRRQWASSLADNQWTLQEIKKGYFWNKYHAEI